MSNDKNILIAERYAQSLIDLGKNNDLSYVAIATDLAAIQLILNRSKDLYDALTNPLVNVDDKENIILEKLSQKIRDKQISVKYSVDESIIAGLVFKLGDDVLDTSVSHRLEELQKSIIK